LPVAEGERVQLVFVNRTPMPHPMHLHGHEFQVVEIDDVRFAGAVRDTVLVPPGRRVVVAFDALNPGLWALHCHLLYHLDPGDVHHTAVRVRVPSSTTTAWTPCPGRWPTGSSRWPETTRRPLTRPVTTPWTASWRTSWSMCSERSLSL
jgi:hypothetical protein